MRSVATIGGGFALLIVGVILLIPLPEAGLPALVIGLRLLGRHFRWARVANDKLDQVVRAGSRRWSRVPRTARVVLLTLLAAGVALLIYSWAS